MFVKYFDFQAILTNRKTNKKCQKLINLAIVVDQKIFTMGDLYLPLNPAGHSKKS